MLDYLDQFNKNLEVSENLFDKVIGKINLHEQNVGQTNISGTTGSTVQQQQAPKLDFIPGKIYSFDLGKIPVLGVFKNPNTYLTFNSPEEFQAFKAILYYINHGFFNTDIKNIQRAVKYGEIDGYGSFPYLSSIFNGQKGGPISSKKRGIDEVSKFKFDLSNASKLYKPKVSKQPTPKGTPGTEGYGVMDSMTRLNKFVKYFIENLVDINGKPNNTQKNAIIARIKRMVGTNLPAPTKVAPAPKTNTTGAIEPGANPEDLENGGEDVINYALGGLKKESIVREIRKIIKDNF